MKTVNKKILSVLAWIKSKSLIIYTEYLSAFFIIFGILFFIILIAYYLHLFITSSQKDKLSTMTTIFSFAVGFWAIKYQINRDFMKKEEENILEIIDQLILIQIKGKEIQLNTDIFEKYCINKNNKDKDKKIRRLNAIEKLIFEQINNCYKIDKSIVENRNKIKTKRSYSKMFVLEKLLKCSHENIKNYVKSLSNLDGALFTIKAELLNLESITSNDKNSFDAKMNNLKSASNDSKLCLKAERDKELLYSFLQNYDK